MKNRLLAWLDRHARLTARIALAGVALALLPSCPPNPPPVDCRTTGCSEGQECVTEDGTTYFCRAIPPQPKYLDRLLRSKDAALVLRTGEKIDFGGAIPCCMGLEGVELGWPVAWHPEWAAYARAKGNANFFHGRLGPFLSVSEPDLQGLPPEGRIRLAAIEPRLELQQVTSAGIGGPYVEVDGKADLTRFNATFWNAVYSWADAICAAGGWVEADMIDGWYIKHAKWGDVLHPWRADGNIQGQDWASAAGTRAIQPGDVYDQYLRQAVTVLGPLGCLVWQGGNENGQIPGYSKDWDLSMRKRTQVHEREVGLGVAHLFGTNSRVDEVEAGDVDYISTHEDGTIAPRYGKPTLQNERNPAPPPAAYLDVYCASKAAGGYVWYWRSEHTQAQMEETLGLIAAARRDGCPGVASRRPKTAAPSEKPPPP